MIKRKFEPDTATAKLLSFFEYLLRKLFNGGPKSRSDALFSAPARLQIGGLLNAFLLWLPLLFYSDAKAFPSKNRNSKSIHHRFDVYRLRNWLFQKKKNYKILSENIEMTLMTHFFTMDEDVRNENVARVLRHYFRLKRR